MRGAPHAEVWAVVAAQVVVVTGASAGVGRAVARGFGAHGAKVMLLARGQAGLNGAADDVRTAGGEALTMVVDVADPAAVDAAAATAEEQLGPIDVWVNVAFASVFAPFLEIQPDEFRRLTEVSYLGYVNGTRAALRRMVPRDRGVVIQVGSALAKRSIPLQSGYCGAKHAIVGFTESVRCELLHQTSHVQLSIVQLPAVNTPQFDWVLSRLPRRPQPVAPIYQPEVIADAVVATARRPRKEVWVGGSTVATLLAQKVAAPLLDRYLARNGYQSQQSEEPAPLHAPVNLWTPVDGDADHGARGRFDPRSHPRSIQAWSGSRLPAGFGPALGAAALLGAVAGLPKLAGAAFRHR